MENNTNIAPTDKKLTRRRAFFSIATKVGIGLFAFVPAAEVLLKSSTVGPLSTNTTNKSLSRVTLFKSAGANTKNASLAQLKPNVAVCSMYDPNLYCTGSLDICYTDTATGVLEHCTSGLDGNIDCGYECVAYY